MNDITCYLKNTTGSTHWPVTIGTSLGTICHLVNLPVQYNLSWEPETTGIRVLLVSFGRPMKTWNQTSRWHQCTKAWLTVVRSSEQKESVGLVGNHEITVDFLVRGTPPSHSVHGSSCHCKTSSKKPRVISHLRFKQSVPTMRTHQSIYLVLLLIIGFLVVHVSSRRGRPRMIQSLEWKQGKNPARIYFVV